MHQNPTTRGAPLLSIPLGARPTVPLLEAPRNHSLHPEQGSAGLGEGRWRRRYPHSQQIGIDGKQHGYSTILEDHVLAAPVDYEPVRGKSRERPRTDSQRRAVRAADRAPLNPIQNSEQTKPGKRRDGLRGRSGRGHPK